MSGQMTSDEPEDDPVDLALPEELKMIQQSVRKFTERELFPLEKEFCLQRRLPLDTRLELERKGRELGFWALDVPVNTAAPVSTSLRCASFTRSCTAAR